MNGHAISPYIRVAMRSRMMEPFSIRRRILFDYELILIEEGEWELIVDNVSYICRQGQVILLLPGQPHEIRSCGTNVSQPHIHFDLSYDEHSEEVYVSFKDYPSFTEHEQAMIRPNVFVNSQWQSPFLRIPDIDYFKELFFDVMDTHTVKPKMYALLIKEKMLRLLCYVLRENIGDEFTESADNQVAFSVYQFMNDNYQNRLSLQSIALQFNYEACYLDKKFKKQFGVSIMQRYYTLRLRAAKDLLLRGESVTDIASALNFSSIYTFSRFFKIHAGVSPSAYAGKSTELKKPSRL